MKSPHRFSDGFTLVEVTLALGIAVFCLVAVFGLLGVGLNSSSASIEQTAATNLLAMVVGDLRTAPRPVNGETINTKLYNILLQPNLPAASAPSTMPVLSTSYLDQDGGLVASETKARFRLSVAIYQGVGRSTTPISVAITWPPAVPVAKAAGTVEAHVALDRN